MNELAPPGEVLVNPEAVEMLRVWASNNQLVAALRPMTFSEGAVTYGLVLADVARHAADMLHKMTEIRKLRF